MLPQKNKKNGKNASRYRLSAYAYRLFLLCLCIHILYNFFLIFCIRLDRIDASLLKLQSSAFIESQILSLLITVIGTILYDLEFKKQEENKQ